MKTTIKKLYEKKPSWITSYYYPNTQQTLILLTDWEVSNDKYLTQKVKL